MLREGDAQECIEATSRTVLTTREILTTAKDGAFSDDINPLARCVVQISSPSDLLDTVCFNHEMDTAKRDFTFCRANVYPMSD